MGDLLPFLFAEIDKIFEKFVLPVENLPTPMNILFLYLTHALTAIYPWPIHPVRFRQDQIKNGRLITIFVFSNWQNIGKFEKRNIPGDL